MANVSRIPFERVVDVVDHGECIARHSFYGKSPEKPEARAHTFAEREKARGLFAVREFWRVFQGVRMVDD